MNEDLRFGRRNPVVATVDPRIPYEDPDRPWVVDQLAGPNLTPFKMGNGVLEALDLDPQIWVLGPKWVRSGGPIYL